jgi:hypothetical protein
MGIKQAFARNGSKYCSPTFYRNQMQALFSHRKSHFLIRTIQSTAQRKQQMYIRFSTIQKMPPCMLLNPSRLTDDLWEMY